MLIMCQIPLLTRLSKCRSIFKFLELKGGCCFAMKASIVLVKSRCVFSSRHCRSCQQRHGMSTINCYVVQLLKRVILNASCFAVNDRKAIHDEVRRAGRVSTNKGGSPITRTASCNNATAALQVC
jgi:hypothetical protein